MVIELKVRRSEVAQVRFSGQGHMNPFLYLLFGAQEAFSYDRVNGLTHTGIPRQNGGGGL